MVRIERFEDIIAWQKSKTFSLLIYRHFNSCRNFSFRDQILRAAISSMNNIAEGYERSSNAEFKRFLYIAKGSIGEVRSMLYLADEMGYLSKDDVTDSQQRATEISKMISGLIKAL